MGGLGHRPVTPYRAAYGRATEPRERNRGSRPCRVTVVAARLATIGVAVTFELSNLSPSVPANLYGLTRPHIGHAQIDGYKCMDIRDIGAEKPAGEDSLEKVEVYYDPGAVAVTP